MEMPKSENMHIGRIAITGGNGFVGRAVVAQLLDAGYRQIVVISRHASANAAHTDGVRFVAGDLTISSDACRALAGCDAVVHLVGIIRPTSRQSFYDAHVAATENTVFAMRENGIKRLLHMSALGTRISAVSSYHRTKWTAEQVVVKSGLDYTIIRPSLILGNHGEFTLMLDAWSEGIAPPYLFMPYFGRGIFGKRAALISPVRVEDVAKLFQWCLDRPVSIGKIYELSGPREFTWPDFLRLYAKTRHGRNRRTLGIPIWLGKILGRLPGLPFTTDQVIMAGEDSTANGEELKADMPDFFTREAL
ncbi:MAG: NAD(P)H-binding protein [Phycisphaerae bacterium]